MYLVLALTSLPGHCLWPMLTSDPRSSTPITTALSIEPTSLPANCYTSILLYTTSIYKAAASHWTTVSAGAAAAATTTTGITIHNKCIYDSATHPPHVQL